MATPVRVGLIGVGRWGKHYLQTLLALADRCQVTHLATSREENAHLVPHPVTVVADWRQLLRADCDAVVVASPPDTHAQIVEACLEAGKPCMVEKPVCLDMATADRLHRRVETSAVPVLVDYVHLFSPAYRVLKEAMDQAGESIRVMLSEGMGFGPFRARTSVLWDWAPHDVSLCLDLVGHAPIHVAALGGPSDPRGQPELISVRLDFPNDVCAWIQAGRLSPLKRRNLSVFTNTHLYQLDDLGSRPPTVSSIDVSARETDGIPAVLDPRPLTVASTLTPLASALCYFFDGLAGGDRDYFGLERSVEITRVLAKCEELMHTSMRV